MDKSLTGVSERMEGEDVRTINTDKCIKGSKEMGS